MLSYLARILGIGRPAPEPVPASQPAPKRKLCGGAMKRFCRLGGGHVLLECQACGATRRVGSLDYTYGFHDGDRCMEDAEPEPEASLPSAIPINGGRRLPPGQTGRNDAK